ncbi:MAG: hypothetical protein KJ626_05295 [Verrucomicrobia bacterium]|nr:hypothetical protein [Verrucomicrobiota bacterium]
MKTWAPRKNKNIRRPKKTSAERHRRETTHRKRLVALGMSEEVVSKLNGKEMRTLIRRPKKTASAAAK